MTSRGEDPSEGFREGHSPAKCQVLKGGGVYYISREYQCTVTNRSMDFHGCLHFVDNSPLGTTRLGKVHPLMESLQS